MLAKSFLSLLLLGLTVSAIPLPQGSSKRDENPSTANDGDGSGSNGGNGPFNGIDDGNTNGSNDVDNNQVGNIGSTDFGNLNIGSSCDEDVQQVRSRMITDRMIG